MSVEALFDRNWVEKYFDDFADREWHRHDVAPSDEVRWHVHLDALKQFIQPGWTVLDVGAGPGRFTKELVKLGCKVVVADVSQVQVDLNRQNSVKHGFSHGVTGFHVLDICDMHVLQSVRLSLWLVTCSHFVLTARALCMAGEL